MALRTLMARVRTSASALRPPLPPSFHSAAAAATRRHPPAPCLHPPAGGLISIRNLRTRINLESASEEELEREAAFLREQIKVFGDLIHKEKERSDLIKKDLWASLKRIACCAAVVKVITLVISYKLAEEDEVIDMN